MRNPVITKTGPGIGEAIRRIGISHSMGDMCTYNGNFQIHGWAIGIVNPTSSQDSSPHRIRRRTPFREYDRPWLSDHSVLL